MTMRQVQELLAKMYPDAVVLVCNERTSTGFTELTGVEETVTRKNEKGDPYPDRLLGVEPAVILE